MEGRDKGRFPLAPDGGWAGGERRELPLGGEGAGGMAADDVDTPFISGD